MNDLTKILNNPEEHYPGNFDTPQRANALLTGLCQDAATEIAKLKAEVLEQCRINGMSAEREDALRAELTRLKASIALDKMAENARELGLDYEPAVQEKCFLCGERVDSCASDVCPKAAQPVPVKTYHDGKPWPVAPKPWVGLTDEEAQWIYDNGRTPSGMMEMVETKLKEKNHDQ
jgi:hypothetical protein